MNFLEEIVAEWYEYKGYYIRRNVRAKKLAKGGYNNELDVLAYNPNNKELIHLEVSGDALSWKDREKKYREKKFIFSNKDYEEILRHKISSVRKIAVLAYRKTTKEKIDWGDIEVQLIGNLLSEIKMELSQIDFMSDAVPENLPILRGIQLVENFT